MSELTLCWLRRDLRLSDHAALQLASAGPFVVAFVFDSLILSELEDRDDRRVTFIHQSICEIDSKLREKGGQLLVRFGDPVEIIPQLAAEIGATRVVWAHDDDPYALQRDAAVSSILRELGRSSESVKDHVIFERQEVLSQKGTVLQVFTPYKKAWLARLQPADYAEKLVDWANLASLSVERSEIPTLQEMGFTPGSLWLPAGEEAAQSRLKEFARKMARYGEDRDIPSLEATSGLSVHLRFGTLSIRQAVRAALADPSAGSEKWLSELTWREFYHSILANFPHVVEGAFKREFDAIDWPGEPAHLEAWKQGQTGYPLVDAAMRCLTTTGWMHNRLRMVVASFLVKDLLLDWRLGEAFFARHLLDFDLAQNNGGWQWCASTGVDAQPTFRIFNPILQSRKFDPEGKFIRAWCPELVGLDNDAIHFPADASAFALLEAGVELGKSYPHPIVDHSTQRDQALALLASV